VLLSEFVHTGTVSLLSLYPKEEAREMVVRLCEDIAGEDRYAYLLSEQKPLSEEKASLLGKALFRLQKGEPLQYVLGYADFCGRKFKVNSSVLIPRPETEQLVREAVAFVRQRSGKSRVLDLCTGSGCIAWSVLLSCPGVEVVATDISSQALSLASSQFDVPAPPTFVKYDIFSPLEGFSFGQFDLLLCNPPYICEREKSEMRKNVLDFEPSEALFVPDEDPLLFYKEVARWAKAVLKKGGVGIVEINENYGELSAELFRERGFKETEIIRDFWDKNRFVRFVNN